MAASYVFGRLESPTSPTACLPRPLEGDEVPREFVPIEWPSERETKVKGERERVMDEHYEA